MTIGDDYRLSKINPVVPATLILHLYTDPLGLLLEASFQNWPNTITTIDFFAYILKISNNCIYL